MLKTCSIQTVYGALSIRWVRDNWIHSIQLPGSQDVWESNAEAPAWLSGMVRAIAGYYEGEHVNFHTICRYFDTGNGLPGLDGSALTAFRLQVYTVVSRVEYGEKRSYGDIARALGRPNAARAVGGAMAANPFPLIVPCHRILAANGLGGFSGGSGVDMKRRMLAIEGTCMG